MSAPESAAVTPGQAATVVASPNKPRPDDPVAIEVADMLRRIENNYDREGSGPGSRFEGQLLEDVQARAVIKLVAARQPQPAPGDAPELRIGPCPFQGHDGEHLRLNTHGHWLCAITLTNMLVAAGVITDLQPAPELAAARDASDIEVAGIIVERNQLREQLAATKLVLQETSRESSQRGEQLGRLQDSIGNLAAGLAFSAAATAPSKKSAIEAGCAEALRGLLEPS